MLNMANFNEAYEAKIKNVEPIPCNPPECFVGSYPPVAKPGNDGPFFVNTHLMHPTRKFETVGTVPVRSKDLGCDK